MKILLVEDHPALAKISCEVLRHVHGHEVEHASTGEEALAAALRSRPDVILLDLNLPDIDGYQLAQRLRAHAELRDTILVALTGLGNLIDQDSARSAGFDAHFTKPMDFEVLKDLKRRSDA